MVAPRDTRVSFHLDGRNVSTRTTKPCSENARTNSSWSDLTNGTRVAESAPQVARRRYGPSGVPSSRSSDIRSARRVGHCVGSLIRRPGHSDGSCHSCRQPGASTGSRVPRRFLQDVGCVEWSVMHWHAWSCVGNVLGCRSDPDRRFRGISAGPRGFRAT